MSMHISKRIPLWVVSGGISVGICSFVFYPNILARVPSTKYRFLLAVLASFCFVAGIFISEVVIGLIGRILAKRSQKSNSPHLSAGSGNILTSRSDSPRTPIALPSSLSNSLNSRTAFESSIEPESPNALPELPQRASPIAGSGRRPPLYLLVLLVVIGFVGLAAFSIRQFTRSPSKPAEPNANVVAQQQATEEELRKAIERKPPELKLALIEYQELSEDIRRILSTGLEERHIGGAVAVATTNWQWNRGTKIFKRPEQLGFERISNPYALVNQVLRGDAAITSIAIARDSEKRYLVTIRVRNLTRDFLKSRIDKGQVVEMKDARNIVTENQGEQSSEKRIPQTAAASDERRDEIYVIPPSEEGTIEFIAYCINEDLAAPNGAANLAIYELANPNFANPDQLHANMRRLNAV